MIDGGKQNLLGVLVDSIDYDAATQKVLDAARARRPFAVSALAVHGVMEAVADAELRYRINALDLVTPDGQPVRWGINVLHGTKLPERCYGPTLTWRVCEAAADAELPVFFYGSRSDVLDRLSTRLTEQIRGLRMAGTEPSTFRQVTASELDDIAVRIADSGARIVFAGLGCPRQEVFAYEMRQRLDMPILAVGAAFDYHAGLLAEPAEWMQRAGLQWLWRIRQEPRRLARRYATTNPAYVARVGMQLAGTWHPDPTTARPPTRELCFA